MNAYKKLTAGIISAWFLFALIGSAFHVFKNGSDSIGLAVGIAATTPIMVFALWTAVSREFREFALNLNPRLLTLVQFWRIIGIVFVILEARGDLPAVFAWPAGYGDIFIGATAAFVAVKLATPSHRASFILWQVLGIADLVNAVALGTTAVLITPQAPSMVLMTVLPLSLIPTFLVPLFLIFHLISIAQASRWKEPAELGQTVRTSA